MRVYPTRGASPHGVRFSHAAWSIGTSTAGGDIRTTFTIHGTDGFALVLSEGVAKDIANAILAPGGPCADDSADAGGLPIPTAGLGAVEYHLDRALRPLREANEEDATGARAADAARDRAASEDRRPWSERDAAAARAGGGPGE